MREQTPIDVYFHEECCRLPDFGTRYLRMRSNLQNHRRHHFLYTSSFFTLFHPFLKQISSMYRAYASGVGLPQRHDELHWQKFLKDSHHRRMREIKPAIDNKVKRVMHSEDLRITTTS
jgi:hypothetical protein